MLDFAHLPKPQNGTVDYFPGFSSTSGGQWEVWNKPKNCMFIRILCIGGGGGGGGGFSSSTIDARGGGGAGAAGGYSYVTFPAVFLLDRLYVSSGVGGKGSTGSGVNGSSAIASYVCIAPSTANIYNICSTFGGFGGSAGSSTAGGGTVSSQGALTITTCLQGFQGHFTSLGGPAGSAGGGITGAVGASVIYPTTGLLLSSGAGGAGGAGFAGGDIAAPASQDNTLTLFQTLTGGVAGTVGSPTGGNGSPGVELYQPLLATGGSGGGSSFDGTARGGDGGDGGFGCGGGGGGAGGTDGGGAGGNGGPGLVVIHTW